jgi:catechol 2,3-dioxygenase-like lactoylglutathione lyase family enzyme
VAIQLNHTIVHVRDKAVAAKFYADILGLPAPRPYGPFLVVELVNGVSLDFLEAPEPGNPQHYAFLVSDAEWDDIFGRIKARNITYYADPMGKQPGKHNTHDGGRGVYWADPDGNWLEIITVPYGGWSTTV